GSVDSDKSALCALYDGTGRPWHGSLGRSPNSAEPLANWPGVSINREGRVIKLDLKGKLGGGTLNGPELGELGALEELYLSRNDLVGASLQPCSGCTPSVPHVTVPNGDTLFRYASGGDDFVVGFVRNAKRRRS
ncbi:unnamed protein product, partial [Sphacelaria rigidula]